MSEAMTPGEPLPPIEILAVSVDGTAKVTYRLQIPSPCLGLSFACGAVTHMVSRHQDGLIVVYDLPSGMTSQAITPFVIQLMAIPCNVACRLRDIGV